MTLICGHMGFELKTQSILNNLIVDHRVLLMLRSMSQQPWMEKLDSDVQTIMLL